MPEAFSQAMPELMWSSGQLQLSSDHAKSQWLRANKAVLHVFVIPGKSFVETSHALWFVASANRTVHSYRLPASKGSLTSARLAG